MIAVLLPSLADELDRLPLQWSDSQVWLYNCKPQPSDFEATPERRRRRKPRTPNGRREYMRLYMRTYKRPAAR